ncbi:MAG TPA: hypothetical protein VIK71_03775 [Flavobacteriales bacterium]|jgi:hypothetical protein
MRKSIIISTLFTLATVVLVSCKKDEKEESSSKPVLSANIHISQPLPDAIIPADSVVYMSATITADFEMHGYHAWLINTTLNDTVWSVHPHTHGSTMVLSDQWVNQVTEDSDMLFKITAALDHDGTTATKSVAFKCLAN